MTEADYLHSLIKGAVREETDAQRRAGQSSSLWCYACGHMTADLAPCGCDFPSEFGCARLQNLCSG